MRIGILTFHRAHNYGAVLQCYALQEVLKSYGHDVEVIDYRQQWTESVYKPFSLRFMKVRCHTIKQKIAYILTLRSRLSQWFKTNNSYTQFSKKFLNTSAVFKKGDTANYDSCIIGSDQLWGMSCLGWKLDDVYLGKFSCKQGCKKIGYAISSNEYSIDYMQTKNLLNEVVTNFDELSFRESSIIDLIEKYTGIKYQQCLDPTLLTDEDTWKPLVKSTNNSKKYIVCYRARGNGKTGFSVEQMAEKLSEQLNCDIIDLSSNTYSVEDFVSVISNAEYVVTTSFHATVFSLIFERNLAAYLLHDGHDSRYEDLLRRIGADSMLYETDMAPVTTPIFDWKRIKNNLQEIKQDSLEYLQESLQYRSDGKS